MVVKCDLQRPRRKRGREEGKAALLRVVLKKCSVVEHSSPGGGGGGAVLNWLQLWCLDGMQPQRVRSYVSICCPGSEGACAQRDARTIKGILIGPFLIIFKRCSFFTIISWIFLGRVLYWAVEWRNSQQAHGV